MRDIIKINNVNVSGKGTTPMLFIHGFGCDQNMWRFVAPAFEEDYKIILVDLIGAGNSDLSEYSIEKYESLKGYAEDIVEICDHLKLQNVILVGHSVSAIIGALVAIERPDLLDKLVMIGPSPRYINDGDYVGGFSLEDIEELIETMDSNYLGWSEAIAPAIMGNGEQPELGEELTNSFCRTNPEIARHFAKVTFMSDNRDDLSKVQTDSLILQCSDDILAPEIVGNYVKEKINKSTLVLLNATGHCPHMSAPDETIAAIQDFIKQ